MSESLKRVKQEVIELSLDADVIEIKIAKSSAEAAAEISCKLEEIAKSIVLKSETDNYYLFICSGIHKVDIKKAGLLISEDLKVAKPSEIRDFTGFAIGGVSPLGHKNKIAKIYDDYLVNLDLVYAAAGTPKHVLRCKPAELLKKTKGISLDFIKES